MTCRRKIALFFGCKPITVFSHLRMHLRSQENKRELLMSPRELKQSFISALIALDTRSLLLLICIEFIENIDDALLGKARN